MRKLHPTEAEELKQLGREAMYDCLNANEYAFFKIMKENIPEEAASKDILTGLKDTPVFLIPEDPGCVLKWDQDPCEVPEHVRTRINPEDLLILTAHGKNTL